MDRLKKVLWFRIKIVGHLAMSYTKLYQERGIFEYLSALKVYEHKYRELWFIWKEYRHPTIINIKRGHK